MIVVLRGNEKLPISTEMLLVAMWNEMDAERKERVLAHLGQITAQVPHLSITTNKIVLPPNGGKA